MSALDTPFARHIQFTGCFNFRDLGGYPTRDGHHTRWRRLFRADGLDHLDDEDRATLAPMGIRTVIDLRTDVEVAGRMAPEGNGGGLHHPVGDVAYHHLPLTDVLPGNEDAPQWDDPRYVSERYFGMLHEGTGSVRRALELLADPAALPAVFHCSVGKDRTGVLAALVLGFLGVTDDVIVDDYALSQAAMVRLLAMLRERYPDSADIVDSYEPVILSVEPRSMAGLIAEVRDRYGSFEGLARDLDLLDVVEGLRGELLELSG
jgi:protein-tyrosine phosphatase